MEIWKPLRNFPSYNGSTEGRIMNVKTQHILTPTLDKNGHMRVTLMRNNKQHSYKVDKAIAETFLGEHPGMDLRHKDNDRTNSHVDNLYYTSRSETIRDAYERGSKKPYQCAAIRIIETDEICDSILKCSKVIGCHRTHITKYFAGKCSHVKGYHLERINIHA